MKDKTGKGIARGRRAYTEGGIRSLLDAYRIRTEAVKADLEQEDCLNLADIAAYINPESAVSLSFRIGYMAGKRDLLDRIKACFGEGGAS